MEVDPVFTLSVHLDPIDPELCLLCQESISDPLVTDPRQLTRILQTLELLGHLEVKNYGNIYRRIQRTKQDVLNRSLYHIECYRKYSKKTAEKRQGDTIS